MLARSKQIKEEKAEAARASVALSISSEGSYMLRKKRGNEDIKEVRIVDLIWFLLIYLIYLG